jgi:hypothetical protein
MRLSVNTPVAIARNQFLTRSREGREGEHREHQTFASSRLRVRRSSRRAWKSIVSSAEIAQLNSYL